MSEAADQGLSNAVSDDESSYRSLSTLAVVGCVLGVLAPLQFLNPGFAVLAYAGVVVSYAAARSVLSDPAVRAGLPLALAGLALSGFSLAGGWARGSYASRAHGEAAAALADRFLEALAAGETADASELMRPWAERLDPERAAVFYREDDAARKRLEDFTGRSEVLALAGGATLTGRPAITASRGRVVAKMSYTVPASPREVIVQLSRPVSGTPADPAAWRVTTTSWRLSGK